MGFDKAGILGDFIQEDTPKLLVESRSIGQD